MLLIRVVARRLLGWCAPALLLVGARSASAQANEGALDLLIPIGARATAMGTAFVAEEGSEAIWWNPAGIGRLARPELAIDHLENFLFKGDALSLIAPIRGLGAIGVSARLFNYGEQENTEGENNPIGTTLLRSIVVGGTFAATFGPRATAGLTYRVYQFRRDCSGFCENLVEGTSATSAVDVGVQFQPIPSQPLRIGVELRNLGPRLQVRDQPQADAIPARLQIGASYDPVFKGMPPELKLRVTAELASRPSLTEEEFRVGAQASYAAGSSRLMIRGGYVVQPSANGESASGPSLGLGLSSGRVQLDLARVFDDLSSALGKPPTYVSIRVGL
jgi:hypothetical protein